MDFINEKFIAGSLRPNWQFMVKLFLSGLFTAVGIYEISSDKLELSLAALVLVPMGGLFFTWLKLEANDNTVRFIAIIIVSTTIAVLSLSFFLGLATFLMLEGSTHKGCISKENGFLWLSGVITETDDDLVQLIRSHLLFKMLSDDERDLLVESCEVRNLASGEILIQQGQFNNYLFLIGCGVVSVIKDGKKIAAVAEGGIVGEISASGLSLPVADIITEGDVIAFAFPVNKINACVESCPAFYEKMNEIGMGREKENM